MSVIIEEYIKQLNAYITIKAPSIVNDFKTSTREYFTASNTYQSLLGQGDKPLSGHFGFPQGGEFSKVDPIITAFINSIHYHFIPFKIGSVLSGSFAIRGIESTFQDVLSLPEAVQENISRAFPEGQTLPWLEWLLLNGVSVPDITSDHHIVFGSFNIEESRSKIAVMYRGGTWSVPTEFAGVVSDNWVTRTLDDLNTRFIEIFAKYFS